MSRVPIRSIDWAIPPVTAKSLGSKVHVGRVIGVSDGEVSRTCQAIGRAYLRLRPMMSTKCMGTHTGPETSLPHFDSMLMKLRTGPISGRLKISRWHFYKIP
jgi:hypothetical protein